MCVLSGSWKNIRGQIFVRSIQICPHASEDFTPSIVLHYDFNPSYQSPACPPPPHSFRARRPALSNSLKEGGQFFRGQPLLDQIPANYEAVPGHGHKREVGNEPVMRASVSLRLCTRAHVPAHVRQEEAIKRGQYPFFVRARVVPVRAGERARVSGPFIAAVF